MLRPGREAWCERAIIRSKPPPIVSLSIATPCIIPAQKGIISYLVLTQIQLHFIEKQAPSLDPCVPPWQFAIPRNTSHPQTRVGLKLWIYSGLSRGERYLRLSWHKSDTERLLRLIPHTTVSGTVGQSPWPKLLLHDQQEVDATSPVKKSPTQPSINSSSEGYRLSSKHVPVHTPLTGQWAPDVTLFAAHDNLFYRHGYTSNHLFDTCTMSS